MNIKSRYDYLVAKKSSAILDLAKTKNKIREIKKNLKDHEKARIVITNVAEITQKETKSRIEKLITLAIKSVFTEYDFTFKLQFEKKNNRVYATPLIIEDGEEFSPKDDMGGGILDVISVASKIILWHMEEPRKRNFLVLDEPFKFTGKLATKAGYMLKFITSELNIQVLMVSHDDELIEYCDRVYKVFKRNGESKIRLIKGLKRK